MDAIKKAIVLAAGLGTRLRPLTCAVPKPLLPVWGESMLSRIVARLRDQGVEDIVVNCHYLHGQVEAWCAANGCRASYESEILGTGGVLNPLRSWIGSDPFYLVNGDIVVDGPTELPVPRGDEIATCLVTEEGPRTIEVEPESRFVTNWKSDDAGCDGTFTYCGFAALSPKILDYVEPDGFSTIVAAFERAMFDGRFVRAVCPKDLLWTDAGTIASYIDLNRDGDDNDFASIPQLKAIGATGVEFLGARGSDRVFFRTAEGMAVLHDDSKRGENARYVGHARWLRERGIPVPEVIDDRPELNLSLFEWAGVEKKMSLTEYAAVVEALAKFNGLDFKSLSLEPPFDDALYEWERNLFAEHCLGTRYARELPKAAERELVRVAETLLREPPALVHRDFQSTNVLWKNGCLSFIDFQGMRPGPAAYDLASLVYDPYVKLSERDRKALVALYAKASGRPEIAGVTPFAAVERLVQCLGAYGRLASVGQPQFGVHVLPALENLLAAADEAGLEAVGALAEDLIAAENRRNNHSCSCGHHDHE